MSILHQNLYQGEHLKNVNVDDYLHALVENINDTYKLDKDIDFDLEIDAITMDIDVLVPLGLIVNELVCNAIKYAFVGKDKGVITISLKAVDDLVRLRVKDNGVGVGGSDIPSKEGSLGKRIIYSFSRRLGGEVNIQSSNDGTDIIINFPKNEIYG